MATIRIFIQIFISCLICGATGSQTLAQPTADFSLKKVSIYLNSGFSFDNFLAYNRIEEAMIEAELDNDSDKTHPRKSSHVPLEYALGLKYRVNEDYSISLFHQRIFERTVDGEKDNPNAFFGELNVDFTYMDINSFSLIGYKQIGKPSSQLGYRQLSIGVGPSVNFTKNFIRYYVIGGEDGKIKEDSIKPGLTFSFNFDSRLHKAVFFNFNATYNYVLRTETGPHFLDGGSNSTTLPGVKIPNGFFSLLIGLGVGL